MSEENKEKILKSNGSNTNLDDNSSEINPPIPNIKSTDNLNTVPHPPIENTIVDNSITNDLQSLNNQTSKIIKNLNENTSTHEILSNTIKSDEKFSNHITTNQFDNLINIPPQPDNIQTPNLPYLTNNTDDTTVSSLKMEPNSIPGVISDEHLRPGYLTMEELQRELTARGILYSENSKIENIAKLVSYLVDLNVGESDLSSESVHDEDDSYNYKNCSKSCLFAYLEVILINCSEQKQPLLDWLETWKTAAKDINNVQIYELPKNNLIKIRIWNNTSEPSGVIEQLNSVSMRCARYFCYSRGNLWGGWEFYENGELQKSESYNAQNQPPFLWKRLCWLENGEVDLTLFEKFRTIRHYCSKDVSNFLGTDEEMVCVDCGAVEKVCSEIHGTFNGYFESKDLYDRHITIVL